MKKRRLYQLLVVVGALLGAYQSWQREDASLAWKIAVALIYGAASGLWWWTLMRYSHFDDEE